MSERAQRMIVGDGHCPACLAAGFRRRGLKEGHEVRECRECRTLFVPRPTRGTLEAVYSGYYDEQGLDTPQFVRAQLGALVGRFAHARSSNRWLDVGCGAGALLEAARDAGWVATGTEVSSRTVEALQNRGLDVRLGELDDMGLEPRSFDVVTTVEVVEHLHDPVAVLERAARLLRPSGLLYLTTPHARGLSARILGIDWSVVAPPEHLQLFSSRGFGERLPEGACRRFTLGWKGSIRSS